MSGILVIDPGEQHVGWAIFSDHGDLISAEEWGCDAAPERFLRVLDALQPNLVIIETFRIRPIGSNVMSEAETAQLIGVLKNICRSVGVDVRMQEPSCKKVAYKSPWRYMMRNVKNRHAKDAAAHGIYYFGFERRSYGKPVHD